MTSGAYLRTRLKLGQLKVGSVAPWRWWQLRRAKRQACWAMHTLASLPGPREDLTLRHLRQYYPQLREALEEAARLAEVVERQGRRFGGEAEVSGVLAGLRRSGDGLALAAAAQVAEDQPAAMALVGVWAAAETAQLGELERRVLGLGEEGVDCVVALAGGWSGSGGDLVGAAQRLLSGQR